MYFVCCCLRTLYLLVIKFVVCFRPLGCDRLWFVTWVCLIRFVVFYLCLIVLIDFVGIVLLYIWVWMIVCLIGLIGGVVLVCLLFDRFACLVCLGVCVIALLD